MHHSEPSTAFTPLLSNLRRRIRRRFLLHGLGWFATAVLGLLLLDYVLDRSLDLPSPVRIILLLGMLTYLAFGFRRRILYPLRARLTWTDLALLVERQRPELHQAFITAVEYAGPEAHPLRGVSPSMVDKVVQQAREQIADFNPASVIRKDRTRRVWGLASALGLLFLLVGFQDGEGLLIWGQRLFGASLSYPRRTYITLQIPRSSGNYELEIPNEPEKPIHIRLARGADLPILAHVKGLVPEAVDLEFQSKSGTVETIPMDPRGNRRFRKVFRHILEPFRARAIGGDSLPTRYLEVEVLEPPVAFDLRVQTIPPSYTNLPARLTRGGLVQALPGSKVRVFFRCAQPLKKGSLEIEEAGKTIPIQELGAEQEGILWPSTAKGTKTKSPGSTAKSWSASFVMPETPDRYRIHLWARNGLRERDRESHSLIPKPDQRPKVRLYSPGAALSSMIPGAKFPLRIFCEDDFGLTRIQIQALLGTKAKAAPSILWEAENHSGSTRSHPKAPPEKTLKVFSLLRLKTPSSYLQHAERKPREGDRILFKLQAWDDRSPNPQASEQIDFRIDLVDKEELLRRLQSRLRETRRRVEKVRKIQAEEKSKLTQLLGSLGKGETANSSDSSQGIGSIEIGQERIQAFLHRIRQTLAEVTEAHLLNGLDSSPSVSTVFEMYRKHYSQNPKAPSTDPEFHRLLAKARRNGELGPLELLGKLSDMFQIAEEALSQGNNPCRQVLSTAQAEISGKRMREELQKALLLQGRILEGLDKLLSLLEDWNDYQDLVRMTRRLRDAQRDLLERLDSKRSNTKKRTRRER
ncbi:MAG TPA: hypothetical protein ENK02_04475 [Planctomycetes bacterium]|nr:hypothetical protein [Planctomycetota bacterium]